MSEKGVTSVFLAKSLGVTKQTISNMINGKVMPSLETLGKVAEILGVPVWQLFASPEEVTEKESGNVFHCPHCGRPIKAEITWEK